MLNVKYSTAVNDSVSVGTSSTKVLDKNPDRLYAAICNDSDAVVYLALGAAAVLNKGIRLNANGGTFEITYLNPFIGEIYAIAGAATKNVTVVESS